MNLQAFTVNPFGVNAFLLWNEQGEGILIDPSVSNHYEQDKLIQFIKDKGIQIKRAVNTHLHLDHVLGNAFVETTFGVKMEAHEEDNFLLDLQEEQSEMYGLPFDDPAPALENFLAEGDTVGVDGIELKVFHIAGHSPGGIVLYWEKEKILFSGDVLFAGSRGRSDLFGGDEFALVNGIKNKLMTLPDDVLVLPGHGPSTTIGDERAWY